MKEIHRSLSTQEAIYKQVDIFVFSLKKKNTLEIHFRIYIKIFSLISKRWFSYVNI